ncbi:MAG: right-handed parallel beta-helix repeat-containing protein [Cyanobacteria bacterium J06626_18]
MSAVNASTPSDTLNSTDVINRENPGTANDLQDLTPVSMSNFAAVADASPGAKQAGEEPIEAAQETSVESTSDLRIPPRFGAGYNTSGGSFDDLGRFEGFVPLWQEPGEEIGFLEGRIVFGDDDDFGATLLLDYRGYNEDHNRIRGGYIGFDIRDTGESTFYQLGTGYESLGEEWDFRFNAYLPIWDRNNVIRDDTISSFENESIGFTGNQLVLENQEEIRRIRETEIALGGFDAEAGYRITEWNEGEGNLTAFGGLYLYASPDTPSYLGWRLRVFSNFTPNFHGGLALQDDGLFGTRVVASVGATFPGNRPRGFVSEEDRVRARLGESVVRLPEIAVTVEDDVDITFEDNQEPLINPGTEDSTSDEPYNFLHVQLGAAGGDGTFENPFGTVQQALGATNGDGNDIVYVDGETAATIPAFTIPDNVRVLSQGPTQTIAGRPFPGFESETVRLPFAVATAADDDLIAVELPFSGDGSFPVTEGVTLGDRTVLAGFQVNGAAGDGISGTDISTVELRNNIVDGAGEDGIDLTDVGDSVILFDTVVRNSTGTGISAETTDVDRSTEISVLGYQLENNAGNGMEFLVNGADDEPSQEVTIGPSNDTLNTSSGTSGNVALTNSIINSGGVGLLVDSQVPAGGFANPSQTVTFEAGTITGSGSDGVQVTTEEIGSQIFRIENSIVSNSGGAGVIVRNEPGPTIAAAGQEIFVVGSQIIDNVASGIDITFNTSGAQEINVVESTITGNGGDGIRSVANGTGDQEFPFDPAEGRDGIARNTISGNAGQAINVDVNDTVTLAVFNVRDNDLSGNNGAGPDVDVTTAVGTRSCAQITGNTAPNGISLATVSGVPVFQVLDLDNVSFNNGGTAVTLTPDASAFTNLGPDDVCLDD